MRVNIEDWIKHHEGFRQKPYTDTVGKTTIGYGRNLEDNGISKAEADFMFSNDLNKCRSLLSLQDWYTMQPVHVQNALLNMCFNLGFAGLLKFKNMIEALKEKDYTKAAMEALNSKWAEQVGQRAKDVALMIRQGNA